MPNDNKPGQEADSEDPKLREDGPIPAASDDEVLDDTARLVREGRKELRRDPDEPRSAKE
jgi:hypothetical protein